MSESEIETLPDVSKLLTKTQLLEAMGLGPDSPKFKKFGMTESAFFDMLAHSPAGAPQCVSSLKQSHGVELFDPENPRVKSLIAEWCPPQPMRFADLVNANRQPLAGEVFSG